MKDNLQRYLVIGPDKIPIRQAPFDSKAAAQKGITAFVERFTAQGYYRDANGKVIEIGDIASRCRIEPI
jgi:hypothetical protein